jgi:hypothetical protein
MPFRTLSPWRRPWWEIFTGIWFALFPVAGVYGLLYPSRAIAEAIGIAQTIYSVLIIAFGAVAFIAWWQGHRDPERIAMHTLAALTLVHGAGVWIAVGDTAAQTGLRIIAAAVGTVAWAELRHHFGLTRKAVQEAVRMLPDEPPGRT